MLCGQLVSDGKKTRAGSGKSWRTGETPKDLRTSLGAFVIRAGVVLSLEIDRKADRVSERPHPFLPDLRKLSAMSDLKVDKAEGGARILRFKLRPASDKEIEMDCALHLDASGDKLLKRVIQFKSTREQAIVTETYEAFVLDAEIPDEKFALPADK